MWRWKSLHKLFKVLRLPVDENGKIGKDTFLILILAGILLFIISLPVKDTPNFKTGLTGKTEERGTLQTTDEISMLPEERSEALSTNEEDMKAYTRLLEGKLETVLSEMAGVGNVKVMVTLKASREKVVEKDQPDSRSITTEQDSSGGNRNMNECSSDESTVYITEENGKQSPYVVKEIEPVVEGVTVVAEGGGNAVVNKNITNVVQALFGIEAHRIVVVKMKS